MDDLPKSFSEMSDEELLTLLTRGQLPSDEKARIVLAIRERRVAEKQNRFLIVLTVLMTIGTLIQAVGVIVSYSNGASIPPPCLCKYELVTTAPIRPGK